MIGEGDTRPEPRMDKEVIVRFVSEGQGGEEAEVIFRKAFSRPGFVERDAVGIKGTLASIVQKELLVPPI